MTPDTKLCRAALSVSKRMPFGIAEADLLAESETAYGKPTTTAAGTDALAFCVEKNWLVSRRDDFAVTRYYITERGKIQLESM